ncbi:MAG: MFS transporter [Chloroflexota bacterium]
MNTQQPHKWLWPLTIGALYSFFIFGFVDNLKGPTLPALLEELSFSYSQGGTILFGAYLGFLIATIATGIMADRLGNRVVLILAGVFITIGVLTFSSVSAFALLFATMLLLGLGIGAIEVGGNALIVELGWNPKVC